MELDHFIIFTLLVALAGTISVLVTIVLQNVEKRLEEARAEKPPATVDIATDIVDLAQLRTLAERLNTAYCIRYDRLARMSEEDRKTRVGLELAHACHLLMDLSSKAEKVVRVLDGSERASLAEIKAGAAEMLECIEGDDETIPLKGVVRLKLVP